MSFESIDAHRAETQRLLRQSRGPVGTSYIRGLIREMGGREAAQAAHEDAITDDLGSTAIQASKGPSSNPSQN